MSKNLTNLTVKLTAEEHLQLKKYLLNEKGGQSIQDYVHDLIMNSIDDSTIHVQLKDN